MLNRRQLLTSAAALPLLGAAGDAFAGPSTNGKKFIFVVNYGGWDPTRVFASEFTNPNVDMERDAGEASIGGLAFVDHRNRPSVRTFFERYAASSAIVNGILVPSVAHENCLRIALTGSTAQDRSDWGAILGGVQSSGYPIPQVVIGGPSFPGEYGAFVTRTGTSGQIEGLLSGDIADWSDVAVGRPDARVQDVMDAYLARRYAAAADYARVGRESVLRGAQEVAHERARYLKDLLNVVGWSTTSFGGQATLAADLLSLGVSRVATLAFSGSGWDTHAANDATQSYNWETLFGSLCDLMELLERRPGTDGGTLADETVLVVLSEMGRTPQLNAADGKDHWPYTSALVMGPGVAGGRVYGGFDEFYYGRTIDPASGDVTEDGALLSAEVLGATLLALADIDPEEHTPGVDVIAGMLA